jgi:hypothetical protein
MEAKFEKTTKTAQVKKHLIEKGNIDSWTAINSYGATRLSAIIYNLRRRGMNIDTIPMETLDRNNNLCQFAKYILINPDISLQNTNGENS